MDRKSAKSKIRKNLNKNEGILVTEGMVAHWFHFFNKLYFSGDLITPTFVVRPMRGFEGECDCKWKKGKLEAVISINSGIKNKALLMNTVLHEMSHLAQYQQERGMSHSGFFKEQRKRFKKDGISI